MSITAPPHPIAVSNAAEDAYFRRIHFPNMQHPPIPKEARTMTKYTFTQMLDGQEGATVSGEAKVYLSYDGDPILAVDPDSVTPLLEAWSAGTPLRTFLWPTEVDEDPVTVAYLNGGATVHLEKWGPAYLRTFDDVFDLARLAEIIPADQFRLDIEGRS